MSKDGWRKILFELPDIAIRSLTLFRFFDEIWNNVFQLTILFFNFAYFQQELFFLLF